MRKVLKSRLTAGILVLVVVCLGVVFAGDVIVKEGTIEGENIEATGYFIIDRDSIGGDELRLVGDASDFTADRTLELITDDASYSLFVGGNSSINQNVSTTGSPTFAGLTYDFDQDYKVQNRAGAWTIQGQTSGSGNTSYEFFTKNGNGLNPLYLRCFAKGTPESTTNSEFLSFLYSQTLRAFYIRTRALGEGELMPLILLTYGNTNQLYLATGGNVGIGDGAPGEKLDVAGNTNVTGVYKVDDVQVVGSQQGHIADADNNVASAAGGDPPTEAEFNALVTAYNDLATKFNELLDALDADAGHGLLEGAP